jgi:AcrR family transcriptional regulator
MTTGHGRLNAGQKPSHAVIFKAMTQESPGRTRLQPAEKREALLDAAIQLFRAKGVAETTVEDITRAAGVAKGTFYLYFQTKDALLADLRVEFAGQLEVFFREASPPDDPSAWRRYMSHLAETAVDLLVEERELRDLVAGLSGAHADGPLRAAMERAHGALTEVLHEGARVGALDIVDANAAAWLLLDFILAAGERASADYTNAGRYRRACANAVQRWLLKTELR